MASEVKLKSVHNGKNVVKYISHRHSVKKHDICLQEHTEKDQFLQSLNRKRKLNFFFFFGSVFGIPFSNYTSYTLL